MKIIEEAKSKINISLNLTGKKENNFHDLVSFICFGNFSDKLIHRHLHGNIFEQVQHTQGD